MSAFRCHGSINGTNLDVAFADMGPRSNVFLPKAFVTGPFKYVAIAYVPRTHGPLAVCKDDVIDALQHIADTSVVTSAYVICFPSSGITVLSRRQQLLKRSLSVLITFLVN